MKINEALTPKELLKLDEIELRFLEIIDKLLTKHHNENMWSCKVWNLMLQNSNYICEKKNKIKEYKRYILKINKEVGDLE